MHRHGLLQSQNRYAYGGVYSLWLVLSPYHRKTIETTETGSSQNVFVVVDKMQKHCVPFGGFSPHFVTRQEVMGNSLQWRYRL